jgi:hypothetical protein
MLNPSQRAADALLIERTETAIRKSTECIRISDESIPNCREAIQMARMICAAFEISKSHPLQFPPRSSGDQRVSHPSSRPIASGSDLAQAAS